jgi:hypothetical protein
MPREQKQTWLARLTNNIVGLPLIDEWGCRCCPRLRYSRVRVPLRGIRRQLRVWHVLA